MRATRARGALEGARTRRAARRATTTDANDARDLARDEADVDGMRDAFERARATPLEIMDKALETYGDGLAIAFSGAEDVAVIQYAALTGRPYRVFSLDTGRLNPETYELFDKVEKHFGHKD